MNNEEIRCRRCGRLLMKGEVKLIEIKCPKCGYVQQFPQKPEKAARQTAGS